jgi:G3E family GTPase
MTSKTTKCPVTIVTGFLGSGKTTLLARLLAEPSMGNVAVLVNEFGKVGLDHHLLRQINERTILLGNGCACCTIRDDLVKTLLDLFAMDERRDIPRLERVIIETSGLADPAPILYTILADPVLQHHFWIDRIITTVDAINGHFHLDRHPESLKQVAIADNIIVTKTDIASGQEVDDLMARLHTLNPSAHIVKAAFGNVDIAMLFSAVQYPQTDRRNEEYLMPPLTPADGDHSTRETSNKSSGFALGKRLSDEQDADGPSTFRSKPPGEESHIANIYSLSLTFHEPLDWRAFSLWLSMLLHARGEDVLRVKGLLNVGEEGPVVLNGVQHIIHPPQHLDGWPGEDHSSQITFITRTIEPQAIQNSLRVFQHVLAISDADSKAR